MGHGTAANLQLVSTFIYAVYESVLILCCPQSMLNAVGHNISVFQRDFVAVSLCRMETATTTVLPGSDKPIHYACIHKMK